MSTTPETGRIRWNDTNPIVKAGLFGPFSFTILKIGTEPGWRLTAELPGLGRKNADSDNPDDLKAEAERWLEEFITSLGASFGSDRIVRWSEVRTGDLVLLDDSLITAERVEVIQKPWGDGTTFPAVDIRHRLENGVLVTSERHGDRYTAVRRESGERTGNKEPSRWPPVCACGKPLVQVTYHRVLHFWCPSCRELYDLISGQLGESRGRVRASQVRRPAEERTGDGEPR